MHRMHHSRVCRDQSEALAWLQRLQHVTAVQDRSIGPAGVYLCNGCSCSVFCGQEELKQPAATCA